MWGSWAKRGEEPPWTQLHGSPPHASLPGVPALAPLRGASVTASTTPCTMPPALVWSADFQGQGRTAHLRLFFFFPHFSLIVVVRGEVMVPHRLYVAPWQLRPLFFCFRCLSIGSWVFFGKFSAVSPFNYVHFCCLLLHAIPGPLRVSDLLRNMARKYLWISYILSSFAITRSFFFMVNTKTQVRGACVMVQDAPQPCTSMHACCVRVRLQRDVWADIHTCPRRGSLSRQTSVQKIYKKIKMQIKKCCSITRINQSQLSLQL